MTAKLKVKTYTKQPVQIEAVRLAGPKEQAKMIANWCRGEFVEGADGYKVYISTLEGIMTATHGDYIIRGIKGEFYPCRADIFEASYSPTEGE